MAIPFIGEIRIFAGNFAPYGWFFCQGQQVNILEFRALYAVIGSTYGGDNRTYFKLPNLQACAPMGQGAGAGLTPRTLAKACGVQAVTLTGDQMPPHTHAAQGTNATGTSNNPSNRLWAKVVSTPQIQPYGKTVVDAPVVMDPNALAPVGGGAPHSNMQPYQGINFIIAWNGDFPVRQ